MKCFWKNPQSSFAALLLCVFGVTAAEPDYSKIPRPKDVPAPGNAKVKQSIERGVYFLLERQNKDGSWPLPANTGHGLGNVHYVTCLTTLMLEVYYRFLPGTAQ